MKVKVLENTPAVFRFAIEEVGNDFANALRRVAIGSVGAFAVDTVTFYENSSAMFDEYIAHRVGLIPLISPEDYGEKDSVLLSLSAQGPVIVYSRDLKGTDRHVKVANDNIPIMKLAEGQELKLDAKAVMGYGAKSSKFQPGLVTYKPLANGKGFEFYIESFGQMPAVEIMRRALDIISGNIKEIHKELK